MVDKEEDIENNVCRSITDEEYSSSIEIHPRDMSIYRSGNIFNNLRKIMGLCKKETMERELSNHAKIDQWIQYKNDSILDDEDYNNTKSTSQQIKISLYYEKLEKPTEVALDNFEKNKMSNKD